MEGLPTQVVHLSCFIRKYSVWLSRCIVVRRCTVPLVHAVWIALLVPRESWILLDFMPSAVLVVISHVPTVTIRLRKPYQMRREGNYFVQRGMEVPHLLGANRKKPADVLLHCYWQDQDAAVDVSVTDISGQQVPYSDFSSSVHLPETDFFKALRDLLVTHTGSPFIAVENTKTDRAGELRKANNLIF
jgi:hypothetical protein